MFTSTYNTPSKPRPITTTEINNERLQIAPTNRIACIWPGALDVAPEIKRWCRMREIMIDLDPYMRVRFRGSRRDIMNFIATHIAPKGMELAERVLNSICEA